MKKSRHYNAVLCVSVLLFANAAYAQWPVFDFQEIIPIGKDVKTGVDTVKDLKSQLGEMDKTLNAIGKESKTFASFSQDISATGGDDAQSAAENAQTSSSNGTKATFQAPQTVSDATEDIVKTQKNMIDDYVNQTNQIAGIQNGGQNMPSTGGNTFSFEEEEEEEEVSVNDEIEQINQIHKEILAEQKQLSVELNDTFESQLTILNKAVAENIVAFEELDKTLQNRSLLNQKDKSRFHNRIIEITQKQRENSDWAIRIVESAKENYNREYNKVIKDGINNYTKIVISYIKGDTDKESVVIAGNKLKEDAGAINVTPDQSVLKELQRLSADINKEVENLASEIDNILKKQS